MDYNKEWRTRENRHGKWAPYNRHKLKNWHTHEEAKALDEEFNHEYKKWAHGRYNYYKYFDVALERKLLEKFVGKPFSEFENAWHIRTKHLREKGVCVKLNWIDVKLQEPDDVSSNDKFYIDVDGIIRRNSKYRWNWKSKKSIKIVEKEVIKWYIKPDILNYEFGPGVNVKHGGIIWILQKYLRKENYEKIIHEPLDDKTFTKLKNDLLYVGLNQSLYQYCKEYNKQFTGNLWRCKDWCTYDDFTSLFYKDTSESVYTYIKPGTPEFAKIKAEQQASKRKLFRDGKRNDEIKNETLLHDIEAKRKAQEEKLNDQKIQRHGFDKKESFRGEEYYGGHKKKS